MKQTTASSYLQMLVLVVVCFFTFFINNRTIYPDIMESRNLVTAREMVYDGHWMVPTMNGDLRLEKPPLPTWIAAGAEMLSPDDVGVQRAMAGLAATMLVFFFYLLGRSLTGNDDFAWISSLILCTSYNIILMGRTASWDIYCHAFMLGAIYFIYQTFKGRKRSWGNALCAGVFLGLSFLSKGPISFYGLLLPFVIAFLFYSRPFQKKRWKQLLLMILVCVLVSSWWYVYVYVFHTDAAQYVLNKESSSWTDRNVRPWYYYWTFFLETGVWSLMTLTAVLFPIWLKRLKWKNEYLLVLIWVVLQLIFLSLFPEKKKRYLLPVLIPVSYLIGFAFTYWQTLLTRHSDKLSSRLYAANTYLISFICLVIPFAGYHFIYQAGLIPLGHYLLIAILILIVSIWLLITSWRKEAFLFVYGIVALFIVAEVLVMPYIGDLANNREMRSVRLTRDMPALQKVPYYYDKKKEMRIEIIYEAGHKIRPLDLSNPSAIMKALPCAVFTHDVIQKELPASLLREMNIRYIGRFDDNRRPKNTKRYSDLFIYNVTVLSKK